MEIDKSVYTSTAIQVLKGLEGVRKRPTMYIGSVSHSGMHHLVWEIIDNSIDEALSSYCNQILITLNKDNSITIEDNGRGIPVDIHEKTNKSALETVFTVLHSGGKFNSVTYTFSGGLHGVGASVVNALSEYLIVDVFRNQKKYSLKFEKGIKKTKLIATSQKRTKNFKTGTRITFKPDSTIFFEKKKFSFSMIKNRCEQLAFLTPRLKITLIDNISLEQRKVKFFYKKGIKDFIQQIKSQEQHFLTRVIGFQDQGLIKNLSGKKNFIKTKIVFVYTNQFEFSNIFLFCNNINTSEGGTHFDGLKQGMLKAINNYFNKFLNKTKQKQISRFTWGDISEGIHLVLSMRYSDPYYEGQSKHKLKNIEIKPYVQNFVSTYLYKYFLEHPSDSKKIFNKFELVRKGRLASERAKKNARVTVLNKNKFALSGKMSDCQSKKPSESELFLVEGDSAGGSAKMGRDRRFQAILPLRGKILNVLKSPHQKVFKNKEILSIINAIGTDISERFDKKKLKFYKVIIMTDADVDGSHIRILLLTFFYKYLRQLIENGNIYIAEPPLYAVKYKTNKKNKINYFFSDRELNKFIEQFTTAKSKTSYWIQRYKGLGEMNPDQLWTTTMNPQTRFLKKVYIEDVMYANAQLNILMGNDIRARKDYIVNNIDFGYEE